MSIIQPGLLSQFERVDPKAILFDLDGTLVDSVPDLTVATANMLHELGLPTVTERQVREWVGNGARKLVQRALAAVQNLTESNVTELQLNEAHQLFLRCYQQCNGEASQLYPGVKEALAYWQQHSVPMVVVTNKPIHFVPSLLSKLGIADYFQFEIGGECVSEKKPSPQMLLKACSMLALDPNQCLMVGDSCNDVQAAKAAGMPVAAVAGGYNHGVAIAVSQADCVVQGFTELLPC